MSRIVVRTLAWMLLISSAAGADELPKVIILGDSISMGYTSVVAQLLKGKAIVRRPDANCQSTDYGLENVRAWLGDERWDVIHFNWGIWDTHYLYDDDQIVPPDVDVAAVDSVRRRNNPAQYRANLAQLVTILKETNATLLWANTTPCMKEGSLRFQNIVTYNEVAEALMDKIDVPITDLYSAAMPARGEWQVGDTCHFNPEGNEQLGNQVGNVILEVLERRMGNKIRYAGGFACCSGRSRSLTLQL